MIGWLRRQLIEEGSPAGSTGREGMGDGMTEKAVWHIVRESARSVGVAKLAPHDLRRTCARLCRASRGELGQIQFLLGHLSVQTTERSLAASSIFDQQSMIASASSRILELPARLWKSCRLSGSYGVASRIGLSDAPLRVRSPPQTGRQSL
jgi:hypothetical protein